MIQVLKFMVSIRSERHGTRLQVFNERNPIHNTRMHSSDNLYQLPYSKVTVSTLHYIMGIHLER